MDCRREVDQAGHRQGEPGHGGGRQHRRRPRLVYQAGDTGDRRRAEPFIGHFLWEYSSHFDDHREMFDSITERAPFYMALNLLRIARNGYISTEYGERLIERAKKLLRTP